MQAKPLCQAMAAHFPDMALACTICQHLLFLFLASGIQKLELNYSTLKHVFSIFPLMSYI